MPNRIGRVVGLTLSALCLVTLAGCGKKPELTLSGKDARLVGKWTGVEILTYEDVDAPEGGVPEDDFGKIVEQEPDEGTVVSAGAGVWLVMEAGESGLVTVPNVVGSRYEEAEKTIEENCLLVGRNLYEVNDQIPAGSVIALEPAAGTEVGALSAVQVRISLGTPHALECIPDFSGLADWRAVRQHLMQYGLAVKVDFRAGDALSLPGACQVTTSRGATEECPHSAAHGDEVTLVVSLGPYGNVGVPSVVGLRLWEAKDVLLRSGLWVGEVRNISERENPREPSPPPREPTSATLSFTGDEYDMTITADDPDNLWKALRLRGPYGADSAATPCRIDMGFRKVRVTEAVMRGIYNLFLGLGPSGPGTTSHGIYEFAGDNKLFLVITRVDMYSGTFGMNSPSSRPESIDDAIGDGDDRFPSGDDEDRFSVYELTRQP